MRTRAYLALSLFCIALAARLLWVRFVASPFDAIWSDMGGYVARAHDLAYGTQLMPARLGAFYPPGAHYVLAAQMRLVGWSHHAPFLFLHCAWGALVAPCAALLATRIARPLGIAFAAGLVAALWPPLVAFSGYFSSEQIDAGLLALGAWLLVRVVEGKRGAIALGLATSLAYLARPQLLLTVAILVALAAALAIAKRGPTLPFKPLAVAGSIVALTVAFGVARHHVITGRWALIADNGTVARLFADTDYGKVKAVGNVFFEPPAKLQTGEDRELMIWGFLGDPAPMEQARREEVARTPLGARVRRWGWNVSLLFARDELWPEVNAAGGGWRVTLQRASARAMLWAIVPLALLGAASTLRRPRLALVVILAHALTAIVVAAFFYGEVRYRVPYDAFFVLLALEGALGIARRVPSLRRVLERPLELHP